MKIKPLIGILFTVWSMQSFAQLNKGRWMLNGRALYGSNRSDEKPDNGPISNRLTRNSAVQININAGYFVTNKLAIGVSAGFGRQVSKVNAQYVALDRSVDRTVTKDYSAGIFARFNQPFGESKFGLCLQFDSRVTWGNIKNKFEQFTISGTSYYESEDLNKNHGSVFSLAPGIFYFVTNRLSVDVNFGNVSYATNVFGDKSAGHVYDATSGFKVDLSTYSYFLGLTFYLGGNKTESK